MEQLSIPNVNVDDLVKRIDAKIAALEAEEAAERARLQAAKPIASAVVPPPKETTT